LKKIAARVGLPTLLGMDDLAAVVIYAVCTPTRADRAIVFLRIRR
jgi:hypothetical protein